MNPYDLGLWAPPWLWHISLPHWVYSILTPNSKDPQNSIYCRAGSVTGASSNGLCVGNTPARWWASVATQHYYVSNIIYGLIQCQLYNCIILTYLHLEKKVNHSEIFHFEGLHLRLSAESTKAVFTQAQIGAAPGPENKNHLIVFRLYHFCKLFAFFCLKFLNMCWVPALCL